MCSAFFGGNARARGGRVRDSHLPYHPFITERTKHGNVYMSSGSSPAIRLNTRNMRFHPASTGTLLAVSISRSSLDPLSLPAVSRISRPPVEIRRSVRPPWNSPLSHRRRRHYEPTVAFLGRLGTLGAPIAVRSFLGRWGNICSGPM